MTKKGDAMSKEIEIIKEPYPRTEKFELRIHSKVYRTYGLLDPETIGEDKTPDIINVVIGNSLDGSHLRHDSRDAAIRVVDRAYRHLPGINYKDTCSITLFTPTNPVVIRDHEYSAPNAKIGR